MIEIMVLQDFEYIWFISQNIYSIFILSKWFNTPMLCIGNIIICEANAI